MPILADNFDGINQKLGDIGNDLRGQRADGEVDHQNEEMKENQQKFNKSLDQWAVDEDQEETVEAEDVKNEQEMERQDENDSKKLTEGNSVRNKRECEDQQIRLGATSREAEDACR